MECVERNIHSFASEDVLKLNYGMNVWHKIVIEGIFPKFSISGRFDFENAAPAHMNTASQREILKDRKRIKAEASGNQMNLIFNDAFTKVVTPLVIRG